MRWLAFPLLFFGPLLFGQYPLLRSFPVFEGQHRLSVTQMAQDHQGLIVLGTDHGLFKFDGDRVEPFLRTESDPVTALCADARSIHCAFKSGIVVHCDDNGCDTIWDELTFRVHPVRELVHASNGDLWAGTYGSGIWVKSATGVRHISVAEGLPDGHINAMCALSDGRVAIATDQGIAILDAGGTILDTLGEENGATDNLVLALARASDGRLWAGGDRGGPFVLDPGKLDGSVHLLDSTWAFGAVKALSVTADKIWVASSERGVLVYDLSMKWARYEPADADRGQAEHMMDMFTGERGAVWWCDGSDHVHRAEPDVLKIPAHEGVDLSRITAITTTRSGSMVFATREGIFLHSPDFSTAARMTTVHLPIDSTTQVVSLHADDSDALWAGTFGAGLFRIRPDHVDHFDGRSGGIDDNIMAISSSGNVVWFATLSGVYRFRTLPNGQERFDNVPVPGSGFTYDVLARKDGSVIVATDGTGLIRIDAGGKPHSLTNGTSTMRTFYSICEDGPGRVWAVGPGTGVCRIDGDSVVVIGKSGFPSMADVYSIRPLHGKLIVAGPNAVVAWDPSSGRANDLTNELGLSGFRSEINAACTDRSGALWLGTDQGLQRISLPVWQLAGNVRTVISEVVQAGDRLPLAGGVRLPPDRDFLTIHFTGLHYQAPGDIRFAYRLLGADTTLRTTRDREVTLTKLSPGNYTFQISAVHDDGSIGEWHQYAFSIARPWYRTPLAIAGWFVLIAGVFFIVLRTRDARIRFRDRVEKDKASFQMQVLRSQVNPHFLFNSFNTLIELIDEDPDKAIDHVGELSDFFREILQVRDKELIPLAEEMRLVHTYFSLEQRRFGQRIMLHTEVPVEYLGALVPPLTVQLLVENALKHNRATVQEPLVVNIIADEHTLVVSNAIRPREGQAPSTGFGLTSIGQRFSALSDTSVQVTKDGGTFAVRIPLIQPTHEHSDHRG